MRIIASICLLASLVLFAGCGNDPGSADVEGKPALKADPNTERVNPAGSSGMAMDPTQMMLMRMDKNRDGNITKDELPDGGLDGYDLDGDGTITKEEMEKRNKEISSGGLKSMESNTDKGKEDKGKTEKK